MKERRPGAPSACPSRGLTSLEAMAAGLPVITYRPVAGPGRRNARASARSGTADEVFPDHPEQLVLGMPGRQGVW
jgi:hypothetical protein